MITLTRQDFAALAAMLQRGNREGRLSDSAYQRAVLVLQRAKGARP